MDTGIEYKGQMVKPSFEGFRQDFIILSGHFDVVFDINGKPKPVAKSLSFGKCSQEQLEKIYVRLHQLRTQTRLPRIHD